MTHCASSRRLRTIAPLCAALFLTMATAGAAARTAPQFTVLEQAKLLEAPGPDNVFLPGAPIAGPDGTLYGATVARGSQYTPCSADCGFIFSFKGGSVSILYHFPLSGGTGPSGRLLLASDGFLYGTTGGGGKNGRGFIFRIGTDGSRYASVFDFDKRLGHDAFPSSALIEGADGRLYGTSGLPGQPENPSFGYGPGTVFGVDKDGKNYSVVHAFHGKLDGLDPISVTQASDGRLYGATYQGGSGPTFGLGTVFGINPDGSHFTVLHRFFGRRDGRFPDGGLIEGQRGRLFGTTFTGGHRPQISPYGTIYGVDLSGSNYHVLHDFNDPKRSTFPDSSLTRGPDGFLYGTAIGGYPSDISSIFRIGLDGRQYADVYFFPAGQDAPNYPYDGLTFAGGTLYGATLGGGFGNGGVLYSLTL